MSILLSFTTLAVGKYWLTSSMNLALSRWVWKPTYGAIHSKWSYNHQTPLSYLGESQKASHYRESTHAILGEEVVGREEWNVKEEADLQILIQAVHDHASQHEMVVMDPHEVYRRINDNSFKDLLITNKFIPCGLLFLTASIAN